ncbi:MAG: hypothetical protein IT423_14510, partial [Pirellulaceae bacterium]|nr:hypothetical protein [Pirellulaceae bacterium]
YWQLGGWTAPRMQAARYRALHDGYWVKWDDLNQRGLEDWKSDPDIGQLYTQAAGLAHFFLDKRFPPLGSEEANSEQPSFSQDGQAKDTPSDATGVNDTQAMAARAAEQRLNTFDAEDSRAEFFQALVAVYRGEKPSQRLLEILGGNDAQQDYVHFLLVRDRHLLSMAGPGGATGTGSSVAASPNNLTNSTDLTDLVLCHSRLSQSAWQAVGQCRELRWLDVSMSNVTPKDLAWLGQMRQLERLSLEDTNIDASVMTLIGQLPNLRELDLSLCAVDDQMLAMLGKPGKLEQLWLDGTQIGPPSVRWLEALPKLQQVSVGQTNIPEGAAAALNQSLQRATSPRVIRD